MKKPFKPRGFLLYVEFGTWEKLCYMKFPDFCVMWQEITQVESTLVEIV